MNVSVAAKSYEGLSRWWRAGRANDISAAAAQPGSNADGADAERDPDRFASTEWADTEWSDTCIDR